MEPERVHPDVVHHRLEQGADTLLVCAYEDEAKARQVLLDGAITLAELERRRDGLATSREIVVYCACPADELSIQRATDWRMAGFSNAKVLAGGVEAWSAAGHGMAQPAPASAQATTAPAEREPARDAPSTPDPRRRRARGGRAAR